MDASDRYNPTRFAQAVEPADEAALLPNLSTDYKASATAATKGLTRLVMIFGKDGFKPGGTAYLAFQYVHLGTGRFGYLPDGGQQFSFVVSDLDPQRVTVKGRNLVRIFDYIELHRMPWIRMSDRDFSLVVGGTLDEPVITSIEVEDWKPKPNERAKLVKASAD